MYSGTHYSAIGLYQLDILSLCLGKSTWMKKYQLIKKNHIIRQHLSLLFQEVWDKDPLSQERMGQIGFTTEKLKDLGKVTT